ncbi:MAG: SAM-dependent methyltransferase [Anaerolineae bacterium]|nr:SAM-dependent methyltransferase [Anaerolineae bacterium]
MPSHRIETRASRTADITCGCRAVSFYESNPFLKSGDWVAPMLLPREVQTLLKIPHAEKLLRVLLGPKGVYEWVIARTKYIDTLFENAAADTFSQVIILGAGFDSRAVRFHKELAGARVFELDSGTTQLMKTIQYVKRGIIVPDNVTFIPINFEMESVTTKLEKAGFVRETKTLLLIEGAVQYLKPQLMLQTMASILGLTGRGSHLILEYGEAGMADWQENGLEQLKFGLNESVVDLILAESGYQLLDRKDAKELEKTFFTDTRGRVRNKVRGNQSILVAERL